ncbi:jg23272 [Pararge aegeria aegeria]|uniref:Jg23272 protein n=1 Tax=Pararge aegeria aegeria TaxID=348720 RepID=A0A8S4RHF2_9NEOP|nr:jg23272 [Pararge aegeria aegeria]
MDWKGSTLVFLALLVAVFGNPAKIEAVHADASLTQVEERQMSNAEADCASLSLVPRSRLHFKPGMERLRAR